MWEPNQHRLASPLALAATSKLKAPAGKASIIALPVIPDLPTFKTEEEEFLHQRTGLNCVGVNEEVSERGSPFGVIKVFVATILVRGGDLLQNCFPFR